MHDAAASAMASATGALAIALPGLVLLWLLRRRRLTELAPLTVVIAALAVAGGLAAASIRMDGSTGSADVLIPALSVAGLVALACGLFLARWVAESGRALTRLLTSGEGRVDGPLELRALGADLLSRTRELATSREREAASEVSRRELVSWMSHDLRAPLAGLRAMTEALEDGVVSDAPTVARYHATMRNEVDRLSGMVDDLFELSRIHAGVISTAVERVALGDLLSDALASADPLARDRNIHLAGVDMDDLPFVEVGAADIGRALRNLLVNAIRHTPHDGSVIVATRVEAGAVYVAVHDACGGIPEGHLPRVFETAFRGEPARSPDGRAGLGLAIARGLVRAHSGDITVVNEGPGCRFDLSLPLTT